MKMGSSHKLLLSAILLLSLAVDGDRADAMITGSVYCDQCKDGQVSLFDYPIYGVNVTMACADSNGQVTMSREETTSWLGNYAMRMSGSPDLSNYYAQVLPGGDQVSNPCTAATGPAKQLRLTFRMFDMEFYSVDSLITQPDRPMSFCPSNTNPVPPPAPETPSPPSSTFPPLPPIPFLEASACTSRNWTAPENKCYWRAVSPDMKVAVVFGSPAARRYGTYMTLRDRLQGRGDPYKTLLREGTTSLLNSYNSIQFNYSAVDVVTRMNWDLVGSREMSSTQLEGHACQFWVCSRRHLQVFTSL